MYERLRFLLNRLGERLWVRPFIAAVLSLGGALLARTADGADVVESAPEVTAASVENLLSILSASMLVIATLAVASMVSAYASASATSTPRSFPLVVSDDASQNALSGFVGAFIYGVIARTALMNDYYGRNARLVLFALTLLVLIAVILIFVRWVDRIARLGRIGTTIDKVETATREALERRRHSPSLRGVPPGDRLSERGQPVFGIEVGYVQRLDVERLQRYASECDARIRVAAQPGDFSTPAAPLAHVFAGEEDTVLDHARVARSFIVGRDRTFDDDPRRGLLVLSEIASRALSPAVNDPGTAIDILGTQVRLFTRWSRALNEDQLHAADCDRVEVPELTAQDLVTHAFRAIARDGAGLVEVAERLQEALASIAAAGDDDLCEAATEQASQAFARAERKLEHPDDVETVRRAATLLERGDAVALRQKRSSTP